MTKPVETDKIVVMSNTGPLISAFQCGRTDLLRRYFSVIYVTASELAEFDKHGWTEEIHRLTGFPGVLGRAGLDSLLTQDEIRQVLLEAPCIIEAL